jgi:hypothetical protein
MVSAEASPQPVVLFALTLEKRFSIIAVAAFVTITAPGGLVDGRRSPESRRPEEAP